MIAMAKKRGPEKWDRLVYVDLLCGPGRDIDTDTGKEFDGSPLVALGIRPQFDHLYLADKRKSNVTALRKRISPSDLNRVTLRSGDCNDLIDEVLGSFSSRTLGLAFVDPEGFEVDFRTIEKIARRRVDLLYLYPSGIGVKRNLANFLSLTKSPLDRFYGSDWRQLPAAKRAAGSTSAQRPELILKSLLPDFRSKVASAGYQFQDEAVPDFTNTRNAQMYHLLFFSHNSVGLRIWNGIKRIGPGGQRKLPGME